MRVTERTSDVLVMEESASSIYLFGAVFGGMGVLLLVAAWVTNNWLFVLVGGIFTFFGLKILLFGRVRTHRFERSRLDPDRGRVAITSRGLWKTEQQELPFNRIADVVIETPSRRKRSHYLHYVTTQGERIGWGDYYEGSEEDVVECFRSAREFMGLPAVEPPIPPS